MNIPNVIMLFIMLYDSYFLKGGAITVAKNKIAGTTILEVFMI
jgi:hypothetical protein